MSDKPCFNMKNTGSCNRDDCPFSHDPAVLSQQMPAPRSGGNNNDFRGGGRGGGFNNNRGGGGGRGGMYDRQLQQEQFGAVAEAIIYVRPAYYALLLKPLTWLGSYAAAPADVCQLPVTPPDDPCLWSLARGS